MLIGVPLETAAGETRVSVTSETAKKLKTQGHTIRVPTQAGIHASVTDAAYEAAGAEITDWGGARPRDHVLRIRRSLRHALGHVAVFKDGRR
jgi:NAD(P) transhydrogenase subunit alpha